MRAPAPPRACARTTCAAAGRGAAEPRRETSAPPVSAAPGTAPAPQRKPRPPDRRKPKPKPKPAPPRETALSDDPTPALQPQTFFTTSKAADRYRQIVDRRRMAESGRLASAWLRRALRCRRCAGASPPKTTASSTRRKQKWDADLTAAVKRFQFRMGLKQTGVVAGATLRELDVPAETRFRQLDVDRAAAHRVDFAFGSRYIVVNIPSTAVDAVEERSRRAPLRRDRRRSRASFAGGAGEGRRGEHQSDMDGAGLDHQERDRAEDAEGPDLSARARAFAC